MPESNKHINTSVGVGCGSAVAAGAAVAVAVVVGVINKSRPQRTSHPTTHCTTASQAPLPPPHLRALYESLQRCTLALPISFGPASGLSVALWSAITVALSRAVLVCVLKI